MNNNRLFDRKRLKFQSLSRRKSKINTSSILPLDSPLPAISEENREKISMLAYRIKQARKKKPQSYSCTALTCSVMVYLYLSII